MFLSHESSTDVTSLSLNVQEVQEFNFKLLFKRLLVLGLAFANQINSGSYLQDKTKL